MGKQITADHVRLVLEALASEPGDSGKKPEWIAGAATPEAVSEVATTANQVLEQRLGQGQQGPAR